MSDGEKYGGARNFIAACFGKSRFWGCVLLDSEVLVEAYFGKRSIRNYKPETLNPRNQKPFFTFAHLFENFF